MELLAKSNGCTLLSHLRAVSTVSRYLATRLGADQVTVELCALAGITHDIGKAWPNFQQYLRSGGETEWQDQPQYHNEISYVVLSKFLRPGWGGLEQCDAQDVIDAVLWHHSCRQDGILVLSPDDVSALLDFTHIILGDVREHNNTEGYRLDGYTEPLDCIAHFVPSERANHPRQIIIRSCLIAADRLVSPITDQSVIDAVVSGSYNLDDLPGLSAWLGDINVPDLPSVDDKERSRAQKMCAELTDSRPIIQVNAPTGFGKTRVGLLRTLFRKRKTLWVCPRNTVADAVFANVQEELALLGLSDTVSAELFYTNKRQGKTHTCPDSEFSADIIVTNIDMLLKPMVDNRCADRGFLSLCADIVFDEYHEFAGQDSAMFAAFASMLIARAECPVTSTMCLSATPAGILEVILKRKYDTKCCCLPAKGEHFAPVHEKPYDLHIHAGAKLSDIPEGQPASLVMLNAVRNAQRHYNRNRSGGTLIHSKYIADDREVRMSKILGLFGPGGNGRNSDEFVVSGPILQAALNISFRCVHLVSGGAEQDLQASRTNRFGELDRGVIHWYDISDRGECSAIRCRWDAGLQQAWFAFALAYFGAESTVTLRDIYAGYNKFCRDTSDLIRKTIDRWLCCGYDDIHNIAPRRFASEKRQRNASVVAGKGTLRSTDGSYIINVKRTEPREWLPVDDAFSVTELEFDLLISRDKWYNDAARYTAVFRELRSVSVEWAKAWEKSLAANKLERDLRRTATHLDTPMPIFVLKYDSDLGLIPSDTDLDSTYIELFA